MTINLDIDTRASTQFGDLGVDRRTILNGISNMSCRGLYGCGYEDNIKMVSNMDCAIIDKTPTHALFIQHYISLAC